MIVVDTSALIDSLSGPRRSAQMMRDLIEEGNRLSVPALVLYEWWRGPRRSQELIAQESLFPAEQALEFGTEEAGVAAQWYVTVEKARGRELDLAIAAHAIVNEASLWTLNPRDFADLPGLHVLEPES